MEAFFETYTLALDDNWTKLDRNVDTTNIAYANLIGAWRRLLPEAVVADAERHLRKAEALAPAGEYRDRVRFHRFGQDYTAAMLELLETYRVLAELGMDKRSTCAIRCNAGHMPLHRRTTEPRRHRSGTPLRMSSAAIRVSLACR
jgi:hypothetical protein